MKILNQLDFIKESYNKFGFSDENQLIESIGKGDISIREILDKISPKSDIDKDAPPGILTFKRKVNKSIKLEGISNIMATFGKCCNPIPGDNMVGFITRGRGMTVHRANCSSLPLLDEESIRGAMWDPDAGLVTPRSQDVVRFAVEHAKEKGALKTYADTPATGFEI